MIQDFVKAWDSKKEDLRKYISTHRQEEYHEYEDLVKILFDVVINPWLDEEYSWEKHWDTSQVHVIDDGDYQGTQLFLVPKCTYQPESYDYVITYQGYGSCSGCDLLQSIHYYEDGLPSKEQVDQYMMLILHLLQRCKIPFSIDDHD